jgi:DNA modification methylase
MCGDSTAITDVDRLIAGEKVDMVFTDPPYGMNLDTDYSFAKNTYENVKSKGGNKYTPVIGDNEDFKPELINTVFAAFIDCREVFLWGADYYADLLTNRNDGSWIVWDKRQNDEFNDLKAESADKAFGSSFELCWSKSKHKRLMARIRSGIFGVNNEQGNSKRVHPTEKPVQLAEWFFERWGKPTDKVVDLYGGSGSTLIACEKTNRSCFMMELDPKYCDVIVARWEKYTGKKAELVDG